MAGIRRRVRLEGSPDPHRHPALAAVLHRLLLLSRIAGQPAATRGVQPGLARINLPGFHVLQGSGSPLRQTILGQTRRASIHSLLSYARFASKRGSKEQNSNGGSAPVRNKADVAGGRMRIARIGGSQDSRRVPRGERILTPLRWLRVS